MALKEAEHGIAVQKEGLSHSLDDLQAKLSEERPKYNKTKRLAEQITQGLQMQLQSRQQNVDDLLADLNNKQQAIMSLHNDLNEVLR